MSERDLLDALWTRLSSPQGMGAPRYVMAEQVRYDPTRGQTIADAIAVDTWGSGHYALEGYEVKCTRSDWRREIRETTDPRTGRVRGGLRKSLPWRQHCLLWYIVAPRGVVPRDELPPGWGLIEQHETGGLRCSVPSAKNPNPLPLPPRQVAGLMRATAQTAAFHERARLSARERLIEAAEHSLAVERGRPCMVHGTGCGGAATAHLPAATP